jgi:D-glycero-D-manno-heptose 1,7-bisphosphate phosphatase
LGPSERPLVMLDRDGVINRDSDRYIKSVDEWEPLPGSLEAIARLASAGFAIAVITNQSGIGRGLFDEAALAEIHARMCDAVADAGGRIDTIQYCPHLPGAGCDCRKPQPGLLHAAAAELGLPLIGAAFIGDKMSDVDAARAVGARPVLVGKRVAETPPGVERYADLGQAADALITERERRQ